MIKIAIIKRPNLIEPGKIDIFPLYIKSPIDCPYNGLNCVCRMLNEPCGFDEFNPNCLLKSFGEQVDVRSNTL